MEYFLIPLTAMGASLLTFFSGFGLGTLLLPAFAIFYPPDLAIALTAIVHLLNNLFKGTLVGRQVNLKIALRFGIPAIAGAFIGAWLLDQLGEPAPLYAYRLGAHIHQVTVLKLVIAGLMLVFALFDLIPFLKNLSIHPGLLMPGGVISGFFGGLSGHQGALRSAFLIRLNLPKESFIATGVVIAILIDLTRIAHYSSHFQITLLSENWGILAVSLSAALIGALMGNYLLKKVTLGFVNAMVAVLLILMAFALGSGLI